MKKYLLLLTLLVLLTGCGKNTEVAVSIVETTTTENTVTESVREEPAHQYYCDGFLLTVDEKQFDLTTLIPELSSVSELYPISDDHLYILGRIDENTNAMLVYNFLEEDFALTVTGSTMCWVQNKFETLRYLKDNVVYDYEGNVIFETEDGKVISMIEYVVEDFLITVTDSNYENPEEIWVEEPEEIRLK